MEQVRKPDFVAAFDDSESEIELSPPEDFQDDAWKPKEVTKPTEVTKPKEVPKEQNRPKEANKPNEANKPKEQEAIPSAIDHLSEGQKQLAETIEIVNPKSVFPHIMPCSNLPSKFHHFRFRHASDLTRLTNSLRRVDSSIEVIPNDSNKDNVDITLKAYGETMGKIQFLHFDRRDKDNKSKYYVKLYFYQFHSVTLFQQVMATVKDFFMSMGHHTSRQSSKKSIRSSATPHKHRTMRKKHHPRKRHTHRKH
jgi:hypothetical protein